MLPNRAPISRKQRKCHAYQEFEFEQGACTPPWNFKNIPVIENVLINIIFNKLPFFLFDYEEEKVKKNNQENKFFYFILFNNL